MVWVPGDGMTGGGNEGCSLSAARRIAYVSGSVEIRVSWSRKSNALVRSPQTARRHGEMFGSCTPVQRSRKRITEVWSATSEFTQPPLLHGETIVIGTRGPSPIGSPWTNSNGVFGGGIGGSTWSKKPSFSSKFRKTIVDFHRSSLSKIACSTVCT